jgi:hypothetical protein
VQKTSTSLPVLPTKATTPTILQGTSTNTLAPVPPTNTPAATQAGLVTATVQATPAVSPIITATFPAGDPRTNLGAPDWTDSMTSSGNWPTANDEYSTISFSNGEMVLTGLTNLYAWRLASTPSLTDVYLEMTGKFDDCSGADSYGLMFRVPVLAEANQGYFFGITCNGDYFFKIWDGTALPNGLMTNVIYPKASSLIHAGASQTNRIGVLVKGTNFKFYINGEMVHEIADTTYAQGNFGIFIKKEVTDQLTVRISDMSYWVIK